MPKISATNSKGLLTGYIVKIAISTVLSVLALNSIVSLLFLKLDIDLSAARYASVAICVISAVIVTVVSTTGFKNNFLLLSVVSVVPLAVFIFINFLINSTEPAVFAFKLIAVFASAVIISFIKSARKR